MDAKDLMPRKVRGEDNPMSKLSDDNVREIRRLHGEGAAIQRLAKAFGVTPPTIRGVLRGKSWKHVQ